jgi:hypothetical protein
LFARCALRTIQRQRPSSMTPCLARRFPSDAGVEQRQMQFGMLKTTPPCFIKGGGTGGNT